MNAAFRRSARLRPRSSGWLDHHGPFEINQPDFVPRSIFRSHATSVPAGKPSRCVSGLAQPGELPLTSRGKDDALLLSIVAVLFASYLILRVAAHGARWLNPLAIKLITRLMGMLLAAIAVQFALNGLEQTAWFQK